MPWLHKCLPLLESGHTCSRIGKGDLTSAWCRRALWSPASAAQLCPSPYPVPSTLWASGGDVGMWRHVTWRCGTGDVAGCLRPPRDGERRSFFAGCPRERCSALGCTGYLSVAFRSKGSEEGGGQVRGHPRPRWVRIRTLEITRAGSVIPRQRAPWPFAPPGDPPFLPRRGSGGSAVPIPVIAGTTRGSGTSRGGAGAGGYGQVPFALTGGTWRAGRSCRKEPRGRALLGDAARGAAGRRFPGCGGRVWLREGKWRGLGAGSALGEPCCGVMVTRSSKVEVLLL